MKLTTEKLLGPAGYYAVSPPIARMLKNLKLGMRGGVDDALEPIAAVIDVDDWGDPRPRITMDVYRFIKGRTPMGNILKPTGQTIIFVNRTLVRFL